MCMWRGVCVCVCMDQRSSLLSFIRLCWQDLLPGCARKRTFGISLKIWALHIQAYNLTHWEPSQSEKQTSLLPPPTPHTGAKQKEKRHLFICVCEKGVGSNAKVNLSRMKWNCFGKSWLEVSTQLSKGAAFLGGAAALAGARLKGRRQRRVRTCRREECWSKSDGGGGGGGERGREGLKGWACRHCQAESKREKRVAPRQWRACVCKLGWINALEGLAGDTARERTRVCVCVCTKVSERERERVWERSEREGKKGRKKQRREREDTTTPNMLCCIRRTKPVKCTTLLSPASSASFFLSLNDSFHLWTFVTGCLVVRLEGFGGGVGEIRGKNWAHLLWLWARLLFIEIYPQSPDTPS